MPHKFRLFRKVRACWCQHVQRTHCILNFMVISLYARVKMTRMMTGCCPLRLRSASRAFRTEYRTLRTWLVGLSQRPAIIQTIMLHLLRKQVIRNDNNPTYKYKSMYRVNLTYKLAPQSSLPSIPSQNRTPTQLSSRAAPIRTRYSCSNSTC